MIAKELENLLSTKRVEAYKVKDENWFNSYKEELIQLKELYVNLHFLEIFLRNKISSEFAKTFGNWLIVKAKTLSLNFREEEKINEVIILLNKTNKKIAQDNIISNLNFGFWTNLFHKSYNYQIWQQNKMIERVFPYLESSKRNLKIIQQEMEIIRKLRNRIFHFENMQEYNLSEMRKLIDKFIYGISGIKIHEIIN
jgi:hypothetical protein